MGKRCAAATFTTRSGAGLGSQSEGIHGTLRQIKALQKEQHVRLLQVHGVASSNELMRIVNTAYHIDLLLSVRLPCRPCTTTRSASSSATATSPSLRVRRDPCPATTRTCAHRAKCKCRPWMCKTGRDASISRVHSRTSTKSSATTSTSCRTTDLRIREAGKTWSVAVLFILCLKMIFLEITSLSTDQSAGALCHQKFNQI